MSVSFVAPRTAPSLRRLFRSQIATARFFDTHAGLKSLLSLALSKKGMASSSPVYNAALEIQHNFFGGTSRYHPERSLVDFVRTCYRTPLEGGSQSMSNALATAELIHLEMIRLADLAQVFVESPDGAVAGNIIEQISAASEELVESGLLEGQLAQASNIRPGTLLLEHPADVSPGRAALLIYDIAQNVSEIHQNEDWIMKGFIVNRPLPGTVASVTRLAGLGLLGELQCFHGGPTGGSSELSIIHRFKEIEGSVPIDGPLSENEENDTSTTTSSASTTTSTASLSDARCGLFVGGSIDAINTMLESQSASSKDFRVFVGHTSFTLEKDSKGDLSVPDEERWIAASGPGIASIALCPSIIGTGPYRDTRGLLENVQGYNHARFAHQNLVWASAMRRVAMWVEIEDGKRGREIAAFTDPHAHASVAALYSAGWTHADLSLCLEERSKGGRG
jgi:hypothetical protein